jgi:hypothetical protein
LFCGSDEQDSPLGLIGTLATIVRAAVDVLAPIAAMPLQLVGHAAPLAGATERLERARRRCRRTSTRRPRRCTQSTGS